MLAVSAWHLRRRSQRRAVRAVGQGSPSWCWSRRSMLALFFGGRLGVIETKYQPMKIAAAEAQWETCQPCSFSVFQIGGGNDDPDPDEDHPGPAPAVGAGHRHLERPGGRASTSSRRSTSSSTAPATTSPTSSSSTGRCGSWPTGAPLMFLFALCGAWLVWRRRLADARWFLRVGHLGAAAAVRDEHRRLAADRERPPALDRAGAAAGHRRRLALGQRHHGGHQPQRVRPPLRRPWRGRRAADGPRAPAGSWRQPPRAPEEETPVLHFTY